jgi:diguanylate cyclase (GGDEF)-like protein
LPDLNLEERMFGPFTGITVLAVAFILVSLGVWVHDADQASRVREQRLVANGVEARIHELEAMIIPQSNWDDAVANLDVTFDPEFAADNIGVFLYQTDGFERTYLVGGDNRPLFAMEEGKVAAPARFDSLAAQVAPLLDKVRRAEDARGPLKPSTNKSAGMISSAIQASAPAEVEGRPYILTATLIQPDFGTSLPSPRAPVVISAEAIDAEFLAKMSDRFLLDKLRVAQPGSVTSQEGSVALSDAKGAPLLALAWRPERPGSALLKKAVIPVGLLILTLAAATAILFRNGRRVAQSLIASEARAKHQALHDSLTSLPNRALLADRLSQASEHLRRHGGHVGVLCLDLDRFKEVNDTLGHQCGDELICVAARRLAELCRGTDTVARLGGDEFAIVTVDTAPAGLSTLAQRVVEALSGPVSLSAGEVTLSCSVGVTLVTDPDVEGVEALRQADLALYRAKEDGRGRYHFFEPEMDAALKNRKAIEADLRNALNTGELRLVYQTQVDGRGRVKGVEALMRWDHPMRGTIAPGFFIGLAEECGLIDAMGQFALRQAFLDSRRWPGLSVAINVSPIQFRSPGFLPFIRDLVAETAVDPRRIELEITEGLLLEDGADVQASLRSLREMGFALALDDFGTGYSSLGYLRRYPVDRIKIDRSFVARLGADTESDAVIAAIIKLAKALNLGVIAEGVETDEQRRRLRAAGCTDAQGYLFSKPVEVDAVAALLTGGGKVAA